MVNFGENLLLDSLRVIFSIMESFFLSFSFRDLISFFSSYLSGLPMMRRRGSTFLAGDLLGWALPGDLSCTLVRIFFDGPAIVL
jgi:hypothetical protein